MNKSFVLFLELVSFITWAAEFISGALYSAIFSPNRFSHPFAASWPRPGDKTTCCLESGSSRFERTRTNTES